MLSFGSRAVGGPAPWCIRSHLLRKSAACSNVSVSPAGTSRTPDGGVGFVPDPHFGGIGGIGCNSLIAPALPSCRSRRTSIVLCRDPLHLPLPIGNDLLQIQLALVVGRHQ